MDKASVGGLAMGIVLLLLSIMLAPGSSFAAFIDYWVVQANVKRRAARYAA